MATHFHDRGKAADVLAAAMVAALAIPFLSAAGAAAGAGSGGGTDAQAAPALRAGSTAGTSRAILRRAKS